MGADINAKTTNGNTPLILAVCEGFIHILDLLLMQNSLEIDARTKPNRETALIFATQHRQLEFVKKLLQKNANPNLQNLQGETCLHIVINSMTHFSRQRD